MGHRDNIEHQKKKKKDKNKLSHFCDNFIFLFELESMNGYTHTSHNRLVPRDALAD